MQESGKKIKILLKCLQIIIPTIQGCLFFLLIFLYSRNFFLYDLDLKKKTFLGSSLFGVEYQSKIVSRESFKSRIIENAILKEGEKNEL